MKDPKVTEFHQPLERTVADMTFTKNFRSTTAEEWYVFLPHYEDPVLGGACGKTFIHYDLQGNRDVYINTTVILHDPDLHDPKQLPLVRELVDELVNRLVGYADTLLTVHAGENSFDAEYVSKNE